ncbi:hypothetical protein ANRL3_01051 [Anaerolineae bacterium]|nr:hypothetical protein ANRL3_01051 [Anaerolineae bacterium]
MRHFASPAFWECYQSLPTAIQGLADKNFELLKTNPKHPSLHLKKFGKYWSARVGRKYRAAAVEIEEARASDVTVSEDSLTVDLVDGRTIIAPLAWFPRLWHGTPEERKDLELIGDGTIIHWIQLDEDLSVTGLLAGRKSGESQESLTKWLAERRARY